MSVRPEYRMPAEWEPQAAVWLAWPHKRESWPGLFDRIPAVWGAMIRAIRAGTEVRLLSRDDAMDAEVRRELDGDLGGVQLFRVPTNDSWMRDCGPIFVRPLDPPHRKVMLDWGYNAWGGKYGPWDLDDVVPTRLAPLLGLQVESPGMILEGGSIDVDGEGTLLTTEACLLNPNRNPQLDRTQIEAQLRRWLGAQKVLWLGDGIEGDDTDGHVDDLTRFARPGCVLTALEDDESDANFAPLCENLERLRGLRDARGRKLEVIPVPMPPRIEVEGQRCPASYMNFLITNHAVLVPVFRSERDDRALGILREAFPGRQVIGIDCVDMVWGLGAVHCVTQQEPV